MEIINIKYESKLIQIPYEYSDGVIKLAEDIVIGNWVIKRIVKIGGPIFSRYKYDFKNYLEFVICDEEGFERIQTWYHNSGDNLLDAYWAEYSDTISYFIENHPIFKSQNWKDYDAGNILKKIKLSLNQGTDN